MRNIIIILLILALFLTAGCAENDRTSEDEIQIKNNADVTLEVDVVFVSDDENIVVEHRNGTEAEYTPDEIQTRTTGGLNNISLEDQNIVADASIEPGDESELSINDYDNELHVLIIVERSENSGPTHVVAHRCLDSIPEISVDVGQNIILGATKSCRT